MADRTCGGPGCRKKLTGRASQRFCSTRCRSRSYRKPEAPAKKATSKRESKPKPSAFEVATRAELVRLKAADTMLGQQVLLLAQRMGGEVGSTFATLSKEHSRLMDLIEARAARANDPVVQWQERATQKRERAREAG